LSESITSETNDGDNTAKEDEAEIEKDKENEIPQVIEETDVIIDDSLKSDETNENPESDVDTDPGKVTEDEQTDVDDEDSDDDSDSTSDSDEEGDADGMNANIPSSDDDARDLIESFLDLKDPQINWKMIEFLSKDNMTHLLMSYISRMPQGPKIWQADLDIDFEEKIPPTLPLYSEEADEIRATQLSYSLMRILSNEHAAETVKSFLLRKCQEICLHALAVFHPSSAGNVYHGRVVLEILLNHWPKSFMAALANQRHIQSLLKCALFRNLHQGNLNSFFFRFDLFSTQYENWTNTTGEEEIDCNVCRVEVYELFTLCFV